jgi:heme-degrading monooxygenase HmoA
MYILIFEVWPKPEHRGHYLELAAVLRKELEQMPGFISVERFQSLHDEGKLLSVSVWESLEAIAAWKAHEGHREAQYLGRTEYFAAYRLRIAEVVKDYGMNL